MPMSESVQRRVREELIDLSHSRRIHVVGIGGPGMAPLAMLLAGTGHRVSGSDLHESENIDAVRRQGIEVQIGHHAEAVNGVDVVVYSTAIPESNVELVRARQQRIPVRHRSGLLQALTHQFRTIGVAGTHGKSTTTALLTHMLVAAGVDPSCIVGADVPGLKAGARLGSSDILVLEADESDGTLEVLALHHAIVTNIDVDHLDYFGTFEQLQESMADVLGGVGGAVVMNADDEVSRHVMSRIDQTRVVTFGHAVNANIRIDSVQAVDVGLDIVLSVRGSTVRCVLPLRGFHNAMNLAAAVAMADVVGVDVVRACDSVTSFGGVLRRFTERGEFKGALLVDDYAHLPAEIEAAISALREHPRVTGKVVAVFQPNRFHRIAAMADAYADAFKDADRVVITDIYASGTAPIAGVTGQLVWQAIVKAHPTADVVWAPTRADIVAAVDEYMAPGDGCISMGCGDIETFPDDLIAGGRR